MAHYSNTNLPQLLAVGDTVNFTVRDKLFRYRVEDDYLENTDDGNRAIITELGITDNIDIASDAKLFKFFKKATGEETRYGFWPTHNDMAIQTKFVLALFSIINGAKVEDFMPKPKPEPKKAIRQSHQEHADIEAALKAGNWGCQKASVYKLISAITGFEFEP